MYTKVCRCFSFRCIVLYSCLILFFLPFLSLGDEIKLLKNGSPYAIGPLSVLSCNVCVLWPNGWMDQDETWQGRRPRPRPHCIRWGLSSPPLQKKHSPLQFSAHVRCGQTCWMDQNATWYGGRSRPRPHCVR